MRPGVDRGLKGVVLIAIFLVIVNALLLVAAESDPGFGAVGFLLLISPLVNGILLLIGVWCIPLVARRSHRRSTVIYSVASIALPIGATAFNFCFLSMMHGY
jgi:hypothetical protein